MKNINWLDVQKYYDNNHFWNDVLKEFNICSQVLTNAVKSGKIITRGKSQSAKLHSLLYPQKHTEETKKKISEIRKKYLQEHPDKVPYLLNHYSKGESYPEKYFNDILSKTNLKYERYFQFSIYQLDFAFIDKSVNLEIDGSQHYDDKKIVESNKKRDIFMNENGWETIRVNWKYYKKLNKKEKEDYIINLINYINDKNCKIPILINNKKNSICECGNIKYYKSRECSICSHNRQRKIKNRPTLDVLLKDIDKIGYEGTGRKYNVTGNNIKKWILNYKKYTCSVE